MTYWLILIHLLVQSLRVLRLPVLVVQQLHKALHVPLKKKKRSAWQLLKKEKLASGEYCLLSCSFRTHPNQRLFLLAALRVGGVGDSPFLHQFDRGLAEQVIWQQSHLPHGVGETHRQLLSQEHVWRFLTRIFPAWKTKTKSQFSHRNTPLFCIIRRQNCNTKTANMNTWTWWTD